MLASTVQFSNNDQHPTPEPSPHTPPPGQFENRAQTGTKETTATGACSFRTQQGVHHQTPNRTAAAFPTTTAVLTTTTSQESD
jgi:hypothetical protein